MPWNWGERGYNTIFLSRASSLFLKMWIFGEPTTKWQRRPQVFIIGWQKQNWLEASELVLYNLSSFTWFRFDKTEKLQSSSAVTPLIIIQTVHKLAKMWEYSRVSRFKYCSFSKHGSGKRWQHFKTTRVKNFWTRSNLRISFLVWGNKFEGTGRQIFWWHTAKYSSCKFS